jgi:hypothetical protein
MSSRGKLQPLDNDAGALFTAAALAADDYSESIKLSGLSKFGIAIDQGTVTGTNPTLDVTPEITFDGTNYLSMPVSVGAETAAALTQITTTGDDRVEWWDNPYPSNDNCKIRFKFDTGGTTPTFTFTSVTFFGK